MKCWVMLVNRGRAKLLRKAEFEAASGKAKQGIRKSDFGFFIPEHALPFELEKKLGTMPLWIVNEKTATALTFQKLDLKTKDTVMEGIVIKEETDVDAHTKMNLLTKRQFWELVAAKLKMGVIQTLIYLGAGYGFFRLAEYTITIIFSK